MKKIGVTGGIGSGKSTICKLIEVIGYPVYYADDRAKWIMNNNYTCINLVKSKFGNAAYKNGVLNREYLAKTVFSDDSKIKELNNIVHPLVAQDFEEWSIQQKGDAIFKEAALMFETNSWKALNSIILVSANEPIRIQRVLKRDLYRNESQIKQIISKQLPEDIKIQRSDYIIKNNGVDLVIPQVLNIIDKII